MKTFVKKTNLEITRGWGNGYVILPKGHPLHGKHYSDIHNMFPDLDVHGGLTFSEPASEVMEYGWAMPTDCEDGWVVGFDTCHYMDNPTNCTAKYVVAETERLKKQLESFKK